MFYFLSQLLFTPGNHQSHSLLLLLRVGPVRCHCAATHLLLLLLLLLLLFPKVRAEDDQEGEGEAV
jgi:hypothetical protein